MASGVTLPPLRAFHKINAGYAVTTSLATLHCIRRATKHDAIFTALDNKAQRLRYLRMRATTYTRFNWVYMWFHLQAHVSQFLY